MTTLLAQIEAHGLLVLEKYVTLSYGTENYDHEIKQA